MSLVLLRQLLRVSTKSQCRRLYSRQRGARDLLVTHIPSLGSLKEKDKNIQTFRFGEDGEWAEIKRQKTQIASKFPVQWLEVNVIRHFLPAGYPDSVAPTYRRHAVFCFFSGVAGSAGMVLSTQCLLLAIGVVGDGAEAGVMAGALNWVLKDGLGQLGGVLFASRMGESKIFDSSPKRWRTVAALCLDVASLMEVSLATATVFSGNSYFVVGVASLANVMKNIGFLAASASRAKLNQSLSLKGNLADFTAKAGSQSIAASLMGTSLGISLSFLMGHDAGYFPFALLGLVAIHQGCLFQSLSAVPLSYFDKQRLVLALEAVHLDSGSPLSPEQVADKERFFPLLNDEDVYEWLRIGDGVQVLFLEGISQCDVEVMIDESYALKKIGDRVHLTFLQSATAHDVIRGVFQATCLRHNRQMDSSKVIEQLQELGWETGDSDTLVEPQGGIRLEFKG